MASTTHEIVGVFRTPEAARAAADAAGRVVTGSTPPRVGGAGDDVASLKAEMREEMQHTTAGAGNVGPFTKEMTKGLSTGTVVGVIAGALLALPIGLIEWEPTLGLAMRLMIAAVVGAVAGGTVGFMMGGFTAKGPGQALAAERGTTVVIDVRTPEEIERVTEAMRGHDPIRIDLTTAEGDAVSTLTTEEEELRRQA
jgi:hypothetical protein